MIQKIVYVPEVFFLFSKVPVYSSLKAIPGAAGVDIVALWKFESSPLPDLDMNRFRQTDQELIYAFLHRIRNQSSDILEGIFQVFQQILFILDAAG